LASEIRCTIPRIYTDGLISLIKTKGFPNNQLNDESKRTTLRLVEVKDPVTQLPVGHQKRLLTLDKEGNVIEAEEVYDYDNEEERVDYEDEVEEEEKH
jgi:hypothetical protein